MDLEIDDASYNEGRADFDNGLSLRSLFERLIKADNGTADDQRSAASLALGFADGLLDLLRKPAVIIDRGSNLIETETN